MQFMKDYYGLYCIIDGQVAEASKLEQIAYQASSIFYEVIRVIDGTFVFLEDHFHRLEHSALKSDRSFIIDFKVIISNLLKLQFNNNIRYGNIKLQVYFDPSESGIPHCIVYQVRHFYPSENLYIEGIKTSLFHMERKYPNIKYINTILQEKCRFEILKKDVYEVILVNHSNCITEGSRSNIFFIYKGSVCTPPGKDVLKGITRQKIIDLCKILNYNLIEDCISTNNINKYEAAFITGTSPKVLPIHHIDKFVYQTDHEITRHLLNEYNALIDKYIIHIQKSGYTLNE
jgi:branched-chain amino acid aminotransferase